MHVSPCFTFTSHLHRANFCQLAAKSLPLTCSAFFSIVLTIVASLSILFVLQLLLRDLSRLASFLSST
jgi:hypothetical protein